jgi:hypothetical protein
VQQLKRQSGMNGGLVCPIYCMDLSKLTFLKGQTCVCDVQRMTSAHGHASSASVAFVPSLFGLAVVYIGCTWLMVNMASQYVSTSFDKKWLRETAMYHHSLAVTQEFGKGVFQQVA